jgi:hypothetical protein
MDEQPPLDPRIEKGRTFAEFVWWSLAKKIFAIAAAHYNWSDEEADRAREIFLRPNDYKVLVRL